jgi:hypothetical protein
MITEFTESLLLSTTNSYGTCTVLRILQVTTVHTTSHQFTMSSRARCLVTASNNGDILLLPCYG